jgi:hypothetical protein
MRSHLPSISLESGAQAQAPSLRVMIKGETDVMKIPSEEIEKERGGPAK